MGIADDLKALCKRIDNVVDDLPKTGNVAETVRSKAVDVANEHHNNTSTPCQKDSGYDPILR